MLLVFFFNLLCLIRSDTTELTNQTEAVKRHQEINQSDRGSQKTPRKLTNQNEAKEQKA